MIRVSVLLPTRNRCDTLRYALETVTSIDDDGLEIIVSDNASEDATRDVVAANADPRIRYVNPGQRLGMSQNWEFALDHARGDWIGYLGDDDGLLPDAVDRLRLIVAETGTKIVRARPCIYNWPSLIGRENGVLVVPSSGGLAVVDSRMRLLEVLSGRRRYVDLPCLYQGGFASRSAIDQARGPSGRFFNSRIPDVYSGVVLSHVAQSYIVAETPLAVNGASVHSTGTAQFTPPTSRDEVRPSDVFLREPNLPFHPAVPLARDGTIPQSLTALVHESWYQVREIFPDIAGIDSRAQLDAVLCGPDDTDALQAWAEDFAAIHDLRLRESPGTPLARQVQRRLLKLVEAAWKGDWHSDFSPSRRLRNVVEATQLAADVLNDPKAMSWLLPRNLLRLAKRPFRSFGS